MKIGVHKLKSNIVLAPIAGYTDAAMRTLCERYGAALTYTEMISAKGLIYNSEKTVSLLKKQQDEMCAVQLFAGEADVMEKAAVLPALKDYEIIDINMGCPVPKIVKNGEGSSLMRDTARAMRIVEAAVRSGKTVTVKIRKGFDKENAAEFAQAMQKAGAAAITVHGRLREQYYSGKSDADCIKRVVQAVTVPVIANGDIVDEQSCARLLEYTGAAGAMIARAAIGRPWIFDETSGGHNLVNLKEIILQHIRMLNDNYGERYACCNAKKHVCMYVRGIRNNRDIKMRVCSAESLSEIIDCVTGLDDSIIRY